MVTLAKFFIENYKFTFILSLFVLIYGALGVSRLNSESFPSVNLGAVVVTTRYDGATADDIETKITKPIEEEIQKVSGLKKVKSISQAGISTIITEVDIDRYDATEVIADLQRAVDRTSNLPNDLLNKPLFFEIKSDEFPVLELAVVGSNDGRLRDSVADALREDIRDNRLVSNATLTGFRERQFSILLNLSKLEKQYVSIGEVERALLSRNVTIPGGELKSEKQQKLIRIEGKARTAEALNRIVVRSNFSGEKVLLKDVAEIVDSQSDAVTLASLDGKPATFLTITKKSGTDLLELVEQVEKIIQQYEQKYKGQLEFRLFNSEGVRVADRLGVLISNGWQGLALVVFFLFLFLPGRVGLMASISLPLALFATLGLVMSLGYTLNTITIIALVISIGMLVDNSVVIAENFTRLRDEGFGVEESLLKTIRDLWAPVSATALTTVAAFLPMVVTTGVMGQFIKAIPIVVSLSLILSLLESFFLLPMRLKLVGYTPKKDVKVEDSGFFARRIQPAFERQVKWLVQNRLKSLLGFSALMIATFSLLIFGNKFNLFPSDQTEVYVARVSAPKGSRIETTEALTVNIVQEIKKALGDRAKSIATVVGKSAQDEGDPKAEYGNTTAMIRIFVDRETQDKMKTQDVLKLLRAIPATGLQSLSFEALVNGPPVGDPVTVIFRSNNLESLDRAAQTIKQLISKQPGIFDAKVDDVFGDDEILVNIDYEAAARLGISAQDIGSTIRTAIAGQNLSDVNLNNKTVDYFARLRDADKVSVPDLSALKIADPKGNLIPLRNLAKFEEQGRSLQVKRYDFRRSKTVTANIDETKITSIEANNFVKQEFDKISNEFKDVSIVFGGEAENTRESIESLFSALILSIIGIVALLVLVFRSFSSPLLIITTIPLGLVGVSISFFLHQKPLSFMALIGIIGLGGIIVNSGIILISFVEQLRRETSDSLDDILVKASSLRLKSVLASSLTTISGLIPTAYGIGGVDYFIIPMAMALAWGLTTGTILTLYWVPPAYAIMQDVRGFFRRIYGRPQLR